MATSDIHQEAWAMACHLFVYNHAQQESLFKSFQLPVLELLKKISAVALAPQSMETMLCPWCEQERGEVTMRSDGKRVCHCPECGEVTLKEADLRAWKLRPSWMMDAVAGAFNLPFSGRVEIADGVTRLGVHHKRPVALVRQLSTFLLDQRLMMGICTPGCLEPYIVAYTPHGYTANPWGMVHIPLKEGFILRGRWLHCIGHKVDEGHPEAVPVPVHGPFSEDFTWLILEGEEPLSFTPAQAAVFRELWFARGLPMKGEEVLRKAGSDGDKPGDVFKVKSRDKGGRLFERRRHAYNTLVSRAQREGLYWMPSSAGQQ